MNKYLRNYTYISEENNLQNEKDDINSYNFNSNYKSHPQKPQYKCPQCGKNIYDLHYYNLHTNYCRGTLYVKK